MKINKVNILSIIFATCLILCMVKVFATDSAPVSTDGIGVVRQETEVEAMAVDSSVDFVKSKESVSLKNGVALDHDVTNGQLIIFENEESNRTWNQGKTINLEVCIDAVLEDGQTTVIGYVMDDTYTDIFRGKITDNKSIEFMAPETGEYSFYVIGASSDTIHIKSFTVG